VASPVPVKAAGEEPKELVPGAEAGPTLGAEGDLELLAEEQVLEEEPLVAAEKAGESGNEEPEKFDHSGRIADRDRPARAGQTSAPLQPTSSGPALGASATRSRG
jgi:hypothetical protein